ncbi:hypothetical protein [Streptomyces lunaelactis]|uniref:hypothetical protein n=1 Tax=Streptomyces lunaelactis TaxID=1535768 RepID=UPI00158522EB|nr:hypothetical protein [Streptomyces lunaelactis]NUK25997.1 hypothetical protein [Streptomyces lunaelactis]
MYSYIIHVRGKTYVWGSSGLTVVLTWPLLLVINNDALGDPIDIGSEATGSTQTSYGTLQPGECWTVPLQGLRGVFANCQTDTTLACSILVPELKPSGSP